MKDYKKDFPISRENFTIKGTILDEFGNPAEGAKVSCTVSGRTGRDGVDSYGQFVISDFQCIPCNPMPVNLKVEIGRKIGIVLD